MNNARSPKYLLVGRQCEDPAVFHRMSLNYRSSLCSLKGKISAKLYEFVTSAWHYDHKDHRALHDMRFESLLVTEETVLDAPRSITLKLTLMGAYFDQKLELVYADVKRYSFRIAPQGDETRPPGAHGDVLEDELAILEHGIAHAIEFSSGAIIETVFAGDFNYTFVPTRGTKD